MDENDVNVEMIKAAKEEDPTQRMRSGPLLAIVGVLVLTGAVLAGTFYMQKTRLAVTSRAASLTTNLISNPGFSGKTDWAFYTNGSGTFSVVDGAAKIAITTPGTNVQLYTAKKFVLKPKTTYKLVFSAKATSAKQKVAVNVDPNNYGLKDWPVDLKTGWTTYSKQFTSTNTADITTAQLRFWLAPYDTAGDVYYFDNVSLTAVSSDQIVVQSCSSSLCNGVAGYWSFEEVNSSPMTTSVPRGNAVNGAPALLVDGQTLGESLGLNPSGRSLYTGNFAGLTGAVSNTVSAYFQFVFDSTCPGTGCSNNKPTKNSPYLTAQTANYPARGTNGAFAISGWFLPHDQYGTSGNYVRVIADKHLGATSEYKLYYNANATNATLKVRVVNQSGVQSDLSVSTPDFLFRDSSSWYSWKYFVAGYDNQTNSLYIGVNNIPKPSTSAPAVASFPTVSQVLPAGYSLVNVNNAVLDIGGEKNTSGTSDVTFSNMYLDEVGIWNRWLTPQEIVSLIDCRTGSGSGVQFVGCIYPFDGANILPPTPVPTNTLTPTPNLVGAWYDWNNPGGGYACTNGVATTNGFTTYYSAYTMTAGLPACTTVAGYNPYGAISACSGNGTGSCSRFVGGGTNISYSARTAPDTGSVCATNTTVSVAGYTGRNSCVYMKVPNGQLCGLGLAPWPFVFTAQDVPFTLKNMSGTSSLTLLNGTIKWNGGQTLSLVKLGTTSLFSGSFASPYNLVFSGSAPIITSQTNLTFNYLSAVAGGSYDLTLTTRDGSGKTCTVEAIYYK